MIVRGLSLAVVALTAAASLASCSSAADRGSTSAGAPTRVSSARAVVATSSVPPGTPAAVPPTGPTATPPAAPSTPRVTPPPNPCAANTAAQLVRVSLRRQHLWMCAHHTLAYDAPITSGIVGEYTSTPTGNYTIQAVDRNTTLTLISGQQYAVKYWIPFDGPLFGFHDASWQSFPFGSAKYRTEGSHGCVHMPLKAIAFLSRWAQIGARVHIGV